MTKYFLCKKCGQEVDYHEIEGKPPNWYHKRYDTSKVAYGEGISDYTCGPLEVKEDG